MSYAIFIRIRGVHRNPDMIGIKNGYLYNQLLY